MKSRFKPINWIQWVSLLGLAALTLITTIIVIQLTTVSHNQNKALRTFLCHFERAAITPKTTAAQRIAIIKFFNDSTDQIKVARCVLPTGGK